MGIEPAYSVSRYFGCLERCGSKISSPSFKGEDRELGVSSPQYSFLKEFEGIPVLSPGKPVRHILGKDGINRGIAGA